LFYCRKKPKELSMGIFTGEFLGTALLILLGNGVVSNVLLQQSKGHNGGWIVISSGWAFAVAMAVYLVGWASGGHLNPAVTLGLAVIGKSDWSLLPIYFSAQILGSMAGAFLVWLAYMPHWRVTPDVTKKLQCFCTKPALNRPFWNFITEVIGTAVLLAGVLGILNMHNGIGCGMGPYAIGILVFSIGLSLGGPTGYAINPARDLGPRIMHAILPIPGKGRSEWSYSWIPVFAPLLGGCIGSLIYKYFLSGLKPLEAFIR
jgi:glycerol uptake facilitator protein